MTFFGKLLDSKITNLHCLLIIIIRNPDIFYTIELKNLAFWSIDFYVQNALKFAYLPFKNFLGGCMPGSPFN